MALVTHHVEEIPVGFTHGLLMANGRTIGLGPLDVVLTEENLTRCFVVELRLNLSEGRWSARIDEGTQ